MNPIGGCYYEPKNFPTLLTVLSARKRKQAPSVLEKKAPLGALFVARANPRRRGLVAEHYGC